MYKHFFFLLEKTKIFRQLLPLLFKTHTDSIFTVAEIWSCSSVSMLVVAVLGSAILISSFSPSCNHYYLRTCLKLKL